MKIILRLIVGMHCIGSLLSIRAQSPVLLTTFPNPSPEADDNFSRAVAALGTDRVGFQLQQNTNSLGSVNWSNVTGTIQDNGTNRYLIVNPPAGRRFYRLFKL